MSKTNLPTLKRKDLVAAMERAQAEFAGLLEGLTPREAGRVGATPEWSLKDLLAHLVGWHQVALKRIPAVVEGARGHPYDINEMNRKLVQDLKGVPWGLLVRDLSKLHGALVKTAREAEEQFLEPNSGVYKWLYQVGYNHYLDHMEPVRRWVAEVKSQRRKKEAEP